VEQISGVGGVHQADETFVSTETKSTPFADDDEFGGFGDFAAPPSETTLADATLSEPATLPEDKSDEAKIQGDWEEGEEWDDFEEAAPVAPSPAPAPAVPASPVQALVPVQTMAPAPAPTLVSAPVPDVSVGEDALSEAARVLGLTQLARVPRLQHRYAIRRAQCSSFLSLAPAPPSALEQVASSQQRLRFSRESLTAHAHAHVPVAPGASNSSWCRALLQKAISSTVPADAPPASMFQSTSLVFSGAGGTPLAARRLGTPASSPAHLAQAASPPGAASKTAGGLSAPPVVAAEGDFAFLAGAGGGGLGVGAEAFLSASTAAPSTPARHSFTAGRGSSYSASFSATYRSHPPPPMPVLG